MSAYPTIRIHHRHTARIRNGSPWVYSNELVPSTSLKSIEPGSLVNVVAEDGSGFGTAYYNPRSLIAARIMSPQNQATIDEGFFRKRLQSALALRSKLYKSPHYRLVHAEADGCPGLVIERFGSVFVAQSGTAGIDRLESHWLSALVSEFNPAAVFIKSDMPARSHEGLNEDLRCTYGNQAAKAVVVENNILHEFSPLSGQKSGWYFDQRENRTFLINHVEPGKLLDAFCYTGALGLAAAKAGAASVVMLDSSQSALDQARATAATNGISDKLELRRGDAMEKLEEMTASGERFDIVSVDPPPFVRAKKDLESGARGYRKLAKLSATLVAPQGILNIASCSHAIDISRFQQECSIGIARAGRHAKLIRSAGAGPDHPVHAALPETAYLKSLVYQLD